MIPEERTMVVKCRTCKMVPEERVVKVPYTICRMVTEERCKMVPVTTCTMEPHCVTYKICRRVPVCVPVCPPPCPPPCGPVSSTAPLHQWLARYNPQARGEAVQPCSHK
jgi:hypothetical protein